MSASVAWRQRRIAMHRKFSMDAELLMEAEPLVPTKMSAIEASPVSIASAFNEFQPEIQSLVLPGAWTVVGKGGKPLKNSKTYDPPKKRKKKKKKARTIKRGDEPLADMIEMPSSSRCLDEVDRMAIKREKTTSHGRDAKHWARYRQAKQEKIFALDALTAALGDNGMFGDSIEPGMIERPHSMPKSMKQRNNKKNSHAEKTRRANRLASQASRCYQLDDPEGENLMHGTMDEIISRKAMEIIKQATEDSLLYGKRGNRKDRKARGSFSKWLPSMKSMRSIVSTVLGDGADGFEVRKRKDELSRRDKAGKKSKLSKESKHDGKKGSCSMM